MLVLEVMVGDVVVMINIIIEGEAGRSRPWIFNVFWEGEAYGSPR